VKIIIENTAKIVTLQVDGREVPGRVWHGQTESGIPVQCFIVMIAPEIPQTDPRIDELTAEFDRDLQRWAGPRASVDAIPLRMII